MDKQSKKLQTIFEIYAVFQTDIRTWPIFLYINQLVKIMLFEKCYKTNLVLSNRVQIENRELTKANLKSKLYTIVVVDFQVA